MMIAFKAHHNGLWLPLLLISVGFTCIAPLWLCYGTIQSLIVELSPNSGAWLTRIVVTAIGIFLYSRYHFLTDIAPASVFPFYKLGIDVGERLTRK